MVGEPLESYRARKAREIEQFPELESATPKQVFEVDRSFRSRGEMPTSLGLDVENAIVSEFRRREREFQAGAPSQGGGGFFSVLASTIPPLGIIQGMQDPLIGRTLGEVARGGEFFGRGLERLTLGQVDAGDVAERVGLNRLPEGVRRPLDIATSPLTAFGAGLFRLPFAPAAGFGTRLAVETAAGEGGLRVSEDVARRTEGLPEPISTTASVAAGIGVGAGAVALGGGLSAGARSVERRLGEGALRAAAGPAEQAAEGILSRPARGFRPRVAGGAAGPAAAPPSPAAVLADVLVPGQDLGIGVLKRYEGAVNTAGLEIRRDLDLGNRALKTLKVGKPTGQSRIVTRDPEVEDLFKALHGEGPVPPRLQAVFNDLQAQVADETARTVGFDPKFMAHPDYFSRGWRTVEVSPADASRVRPDGGGIGATPGFAKPRIDDSFSQILRSVYTRANGSQYRLEPTSWNPYEQMALRRVAGVEFREQTVLVGRLKETGTAVIADGPLPEGYRVPRVGPAFEGRPKIAAGVEEGDPARFFGFTDRYAVPDKIADVLENMYGQRVSLGRGPDAILASLQGAKRVKLMGSLFQQVDFATRTGFASFGGALDDLLAGKPVAAVAKIAKIPAEMGQLVAANISPVRRARLRDEILSGKALFPSRPGITLRAVAEAGWSQADISIVRRDIRQAFTDSTGGRSLTGAARRNLGRLEAANQRGLFDGVYPQAQVTALKNWILPRLMRQHPDWTDAQIAGQAADEVNKAFSTLGDYQTIFKNPYVQHLTHNLIFSTNEPQALIRGAGSAFHGPNKLLWTEFYLGGFLFLGTVANLVHMATTTILDGRPETLPVERYNPLKIDERSPVGVSYNTRFLAPDTPIPGEGGRRTTMDLVGQMDTALRLLDPVGFLTARMNVGPRALRNQLSGEDFFGNRIDTVGPKGAVSRAAQLASDVYEPIGAGQLRSQTVAPREKREAVGTAGGVAQAAGFNLRAETSQAAVGRGGFDALSGEQQFKAIPAETWRIIGEQQAFKDMTGKHPNVFEWYQDTFEDVSKQMKAAGLSPGQIQVEADKAVTSHPVYQAYLELRTVLRTQWVTRNPEEAIALWNRESQKPTDERSWTPTKEQREIMSGYIQARDSRLVGAR